MSTTEYIGEFVVEPHEGGTRIIASGRGGMRGLWRLFEPVLAVDVKKCLRVELGKIKSAVEDRQDAPPHARTS